MPNSLYRDLDHQETDEWLQAIKSVIERDGPERAQFLVKQISNYLVKNNMITPKTFFTDYINTLNVEHEAAYPGDVTLEDQIDAVIRWNAVMIVLRAAQKNLDLGGHIATFQSAATIYDVCYHHIFRAHNARDGGDLIYFQGHCAPGIYARAFVEGRLSAVQLDKFRQEMDAEGLPSYPHPKSLPTFWQFPTVSMGLGAISAIHQARFLRYLHQRQLKDTSAQTVYAFLGDGEMNEPESKGALTTAARDQLDNLIFVINCNLQGLDGPVVGNGKIIQELEGVFRGAGWEVFKVIWGSGWDKLLQKDSGGQLLRLMNETLDGDYQTFKSKDGAYIRQHFFGRYPETAQLVADLSDDEIWSLQRGGHDRHKLYSAFMQAKAVTGKPAAILIKTVKGYGMGVGIQGNNTAHQSKQMEQANLRQFCNYFNLATTDEQIAQLSYITLKPGSKAHNYLHARRQELFGYLPYRLINETNSLSIPAFEILASLLEEQKRAISTTMAFVRALHLLLKDPNCGAHVVPIIADEARTFGMETLFRQFSIYNPQGQRYTPADKGQLAYYRENIQGQILQEGISELGGAASWLAAATSYSTNDLPMIPFYIYYSMFGFQRIGDLLWAAGDQQARGFLIGATSGRTTLSGEGLQHADGHSHIQALTIPNCICYDPAYAYELAVILQDGLHRMHHKQDNVFYYITIGNENYHHPAIPENVIEGICNGIYLLEQSEQQKIQVQLLGSGAILRHVRQAAQILLDSYNIGFRVYSVTSFTELARDGQRCVRWNRLHPSAAEQIPYVSQILDDSPTIAATDYMKLFAEQIRAYVPSRDYCVLGTDGFGRSDGRDQLRHHFEVDAKNIILATLHTLVKRKDIDSAIVTDAIQRYGINAEKMDPLYA